MRVALAERDSPVRNEIAFASRVMASAPHSPACPTTHPVRKNRMMPRIVRTFGVKTPANVPNRPAAGVNEEAGRSAIGWDEQKRRAVGRVSSRERHARYGTNALPHISKMRQS